MALSLAVHPVDRIHSSNKTKLESSSLSVKISELRGYLLEDRRLESVDLEIVHPGDRCRVGYVFDVLEPRAKAPGDGPDFPGILGPLEPAGRGTTHVLRGAAVTVVDGGQPGGELGYSARRGGVSKVLEMSGPAAAASAYGLLAHLVVVPHAFPDVTRHAVLNSLRLASVKAAAYLAKAATSKPPSYNEVFDLDSPDPESREAPPKVAYIGQVHGHQHGTEIDEHILYGGNTLGMMPVPLHPNEWLDGAVVISYSWGARGLETYFHQNHPIILDLYRLHQAGEIVFAGAVATVSSDRRDELDRNSMMAANIAKWDLKADGVILTKYVGGAPHTDMFETARVCEELGIKTVALVSDTALDRRWESATLMNLPGVDAVVNHSEGMDVSWPANPVERVIAGNSDVASELAELRELVAVNVCGVANNQGASRLRSMLF